MTAPGSEEAGRRRTRWRLLGLIAVVLLVPATLAAYLVNREPAEASYLPFAVAADGTGIDLGTLGGEVGMAEDVNADGTVVGYASTADGSLHAFLSRDGTMTDLGLSGQGMAINDSGQVVSSLMDPLPAGYRSFLWTDGQVRELTSDMGPVYSAADIDERGRVVGEVKGAPRLYTGPIDQSTGSPELIGALWENGRVTLLETADAMITRPVCISESGEVLGQGRVKISPYANRILLWRAGNIIDLGTGGAIAMNDRGQVLLEKQEGDSGSRFLCYLWQAGRFTPLNDKDGTNLRAYDINSSGIVVGQIDDRAAVWRDGRITRLNLHSKNVVPAAINDAGTVVGQRQK